MTVTVPYIPGTSTTIARIQRPYNIRAAHKPMFTLQKLLVLREKTNLKTDQEKFIRSNDLTSKPLVLVRPAESYPRG